MEEIRIVLFLAMLAVTGWLDFKTRVIDDRWFVLFGGLGAVLYLLDWQDTNSYEALVIPCSVTASVSLWRFKVIGPADVFVIITGSVIYPVYVGLMPTMLMVMIGVAGLAPAVLIGGNVLLNFSDVVMRGGLFGDVSDNRWRKCIAFFTMHRQRKFDRHVFLAENAADGKRRLEFRFARPNQEFAGPSTWRYVEYAAPFATFAAIFGFFMMVVQHAYGWYDLFPLASL